MAVWDVQRRSRVTGEKHHGKLHYETERSEEVWNEIEQACLFVEAWGDQPRR